MSCFGNRLVEKGRGIHVRACEKRAETESCLSRHSVSAAKFKSHLEGFSLDEPSYLPFDLLLLSLSLYLARHLDPDARAIDIFPPFSYIDARLIG